MQVLFYSNIKLQISQDLSWLTKKKSLHMKKKSLVTQKQKSTIHLETKLIKYSKIQRRNEMALHSYDSIFGRIIQTLFFVNYIEALQEP
jgi:hypothetical protein